MINVKNKDLGIKLLNELMVDIIGALIPGFLFIIVVFVSAVVPCLIYCESSETNQVTNVTNGGFWWVLLITCIIFSYVIGHICYRADIAVPDRLDVDIQIKKFIKEVKNKQYDRDTLKSLVLREIKILNKRISSNLNGAQSERDDTKFRAHLSQACDAAIERIENNLLPDSRDDENFLKIVFPEDTISINGKVNFSKLSQSSKDVITEYEDYFDFSNGDIEPQLRYLLIFYCILHCQMDIGCATAKRCEFPYTNYYKYLLKRNMWELLEYVNWFTIEERSKNKINSLKIQIQIFANEAYALINKNESHIRMSSSTWHITKLLIFVTSASALAFFVIAFINWICTPGGIKMVQCIAFLLPLMMLLLVAYIRQSITKYIHYQRMREIQYTLQIYHQFKKIIEFRRKDYSFL